MSTAKFSPIFIIGHIRIGSVEGASCVNLGNNWPTGFESYKKHNQGFGEVSGDHNQLPDSRSYLQDSDLIDMFSHANDDIPEWAKQMMKPSATEPESASAQVDVEKE